MTLLPKQEFRHKNRSVLSTPQKWSFPTKKTIGPPPQHKITDFEECYVDVNKGKLRAVERTHEIDTTFTMGRVRGRLRAERKMLRLVNVPFSMMTIIFDVYKYSTAPQIYAPLRTGIYKYMPSDFFGDRHPEPHLAVNFPLDGLGYNDKVKLSTAFACCVENSIRAFESACMGFNEDLDQVKLWFGEDQDFYEVTLPRVISGIDEINKVLIDPSRSITFIDMRYQRKRNGMPSSIIEPAPGLSTCYGKSFTDFTKETFPCDRGIRILVGEHMMQPYHSVQDISLIIYHELTHQLIKTVDTGYGCNADGNQESMTIFGEDNAKKLAINSPGKTVSFAECWACFVAGFNTNL